MHGSKLNQEATNTYSQSYSAKIVEDFFSKNDSITGQQIISVTPIRQVNFLILKALFDEWQEEIKKFKSPYFDYKNEDVNQALKAFINTLSKHILIEKEHFAPLMERAVVSTLELLYEPEKFYHQELSKSTSSDKSRELKANGKYIKLHRGLFDDLVARLEAGDELNIAIQSAVSQYEINSEEKEEVEAFFSSTLKLDVLVKEEEPKAEDLPMPEPLDELEEMETLTPEETSEQEEINQEFEPVQEEEEEAPAHNINQQYKEDIKTLNQRYEEKEKANTVAAALESKSLSNLKNNININQRYMFVNDLFEGNDKDYEVAMDEVEACDSFDSSVELLVQNYSKKYAWDMNSDEVKELLKVIFKRFR